MQRFKDTVGEEPTFIFASMRLHIYKQTTEVPFLRIIELNHQWKKQKMLFKANIVRERQGLTRRKVFSI